MPQVTINIDSEDKTAIVKLAEIYKEKTKQRKVSQADMVHLLIEHYKDNNGI